MTRDRAIAEAISDGINAAYAIVTALRASAPQSPDHGWLIALEQMEQALRGVMANEVKTSMVVSEATCDLIRQVATLVGEWTATEKPPPGLVTAAEAVLRSFRVQG